MILYLLCWTLVDNGWILTFWEPNLTFLGIKIRFELWKILIESLFITHDLGFSAKIRNFLSLNGLKSSIPNWSHTSHRRLCCLSQANCVLPLTGFYLVSIHRWWCYQRDGIGFFFVSHGTHHCWLTYWLLQKWQLSLGEVAKRHLEG